MKHAISFVEVDHAYVEYTQPTGLLGRLTGESKPAYSVLRNLTLTMRLGEQLTVIGPPGSGKSTLLKLLAGGISPSSGAVLVNGKRPHELRNSAAGYVSAEETEPRRETAHDILYAFGKTHDIANLPARIGLVAEAVRLGSTLYRTAATLSSTEKLRLNLARAALADAPLLLLDDVADQLGTEEMARLLRTVFRGRTALLTTRFAATAEQLGLPMVILSKGTIAHLGTQRQLAEQVAAKQVVDVWVEGINYNLVRQLRTIPGVLTVQLLPCTEFSGQHVRLTIQSARYLPAMYDSISRTPLLKIEEQLPSLHDILLQLRPS